MPALIYDTTTQAFKDADTPKIYSSSDGAFVDAHGKIWDETAQAWVDAWDTSTGYELFSNGAWNVPFYIANSNVLYINPNNGAFTGKTLGGGQTEYYCYTNSKIDITDYSMLVIDMIPYSTGGNDGVGAAWISVCFSSTQSLSGRIGTPKNNDPLDGTFYSYFRYQADQYFTVTGRSDIRSEIEIPISAYSGEYYFVIQFGNWNGAYGTICFEMFNVKLV